MIPAEFDYARPDSVDEAVAALGRAGEDAKVLAGGQSLLPLLRLRLAVPERAGRRRRRRRAARRPARTATTLVIGAMTTHHEVLHDPLVRRALPAAGAGHRDGRRPGGPAPRHLRRLAGARRPGRRPAGGGARAGRRVRHRGPDGRRTVPARDFFSDYLETALQPGEVLVEVRVPGSAPAGAATTRSSTGSPRPGRSSAWPRWSGATTAPIAEARIGLTNMGPTPLRAAGRRAGAGRRGRRTAAIAPAAELAADGTEPPSDLSAQPDYRRAPGPGADPAGGAKAAAG